MKKGYLAVPPYSVEKPQFIDEKQAYYNGYSASSPLMEDEADYFRPQHHRSWLHQKWIHLSYYLLFLSPRQKEKSTRRSLVLRSRTRGIKLLFTLVFCSLSIYFIHRFVHNHIHYALPTEAALKYMKGMPSAANIKRHYMSQPPTVAKTGSEQDKTWAKMTHEAWINYGLSSVSIATYWPLLTTPPQHQSLILLNSGTMLAPKAQAYAGTGNVTGPVVYVNYGRLSDFQFLEARGVLFKDTIALMRQDPDTMKPGIQVKIAQTFGCLGAILYQDPIDNPWSSDDMTSVQFSIGDPLTPGYAATEYAIRKEQVRAMPKIPSVSLAWQDALLLLKATEGFGVEMDNGGGICNLTYSSGPSQTLVQLVNMHAYEIKPVWNVVGKIKGSVEPQRAIIVGAHRSDDSSSAILMELVRTIGFLLERGWKPRRTIIIASWDASEYGAVGSTEWAEDHQAWLTEEAVAYLHVYSVVSGTQLDVQASPLLHQLFKDIADAQLDDYTMVLPNVDTEASAFFSHLGISSLSMHLRNNNNNNNNNSNRVYADFQLEQTLTQIWGQLIIHLSSEPLLSLHPHDTTAAMSRFLEEYTNVPYTTTALQSLQFTAERMEAHIAHLHNQLAVKKHVSRKLVRQMDRSNARAMMFERAFLQPKERGWYRHAMYGPDVSTGVSSMLPVLIHAVQSGNMSFVEQVDVSMAKIVEKAEKALLWDDQLDDDDNDLSLDKDDKEDN